MMYELTILLEKRIDALRYQHGSTSNRLNDSRQKLNQENVSPVLVPGVRFFDLSHHLPRS